MRSTRIVSLVLGCVMLLPGIGLVVAGGGLAVAAAMQDEDGYIDVQLGQLASEGVAITAEDLELILEPGTPSWLIDAFSVDTRLVIDSPDSAGPVFAGVAPADQVATYLDGAAHTRIAAVENERFFASDRATPQLDQQAGSLEIAPPVDQDFWAASVSGTGTQVLDWQLADGRWTIALMNADGSAGVAADAEVGIHVAYLWRAALILSLVGPLLIAIAVTLIVVGAKTSDSTKPTNVGDEAALGFRPSGPAPPMPVPAAGADGVSVQGSSPVSLNAHLDPGLSRGLWLVKWAMAIPHFLVLAVLWVAFGLLTVAAGVAILFTGMYPRSIFDFNLGVLRWSWRVSYYATSGGLGTDTYPPFSLQDDPSYPARLDIAYPQRLSRSLVLVKWWLLAIPHYLILALLIGGTVRSITATIPTLEIAIVAGGGLLGLLVLIAALMLLFTGRYPPRLFDLVVGLNRWVYRVVAYAALMTDVYPPFRLDQGGPDPTNGPSGPPQPPHAGLPPAPDREPALTL